MGQAELAQAIPPPTTKYVGQTLMRPGERLSYASEARLGISDLFAHDAQRLDLRASQKKMQIRENNCCAVK